MTTAQRTDIHRPSSPDFDPEAYVCLGVFDLHPEEGDRFAHMQAVNFQVDRGNTFARAPHGAGQCGHCGQHLRYAALMLHADTNTIMHVGETCLDERFSGTAGEFARLRAEAAVKAAATREANLRNETAAAAVEFVLAVGDERLAELTYVGNGGSVDDNEFLFDVARKLVRYGDLSQRQVEAVCRAVTRDADRRAQAEARAKADAERKATAAPAPLGKVEVTGVIEHTWIKSHDYGVAVKMRVRGAGGYAVISTVPAAVLREIGDDETVLRGRTITFTATLELARFDPDPTVAFASRPSRARLT